MCLASTGLVEIPREFWDQVFENPDFDNGETFYLVEIGGKRDIMYINESGIPWVRDNGIFYDNSVKIKCIKEIKVEDF